jgi:hypothetical protein
MYIILSIIIEFRIYVSKIYEAKCTGVHVHVYEHVHVCVRACVSAHACTEGTCISN